MIFNVFSLTDGFKFGEIVNGNEHDLEFVESDNCVTHTIVGLFSIMASPVGRVTLV